MPICVTNPRRLPLQSVLKMGPTCALKPTSNRGSRNQSRPNPNNVPITSCALGAKNAVIGRWTPSARRTSGLTAMPTSPVSGSPIPHGVPFPGYTFKPGSPRTSSETRPVRTAIADDGLVRIRKVLQLAQSTGAPNLRAFQRTPVELTAVITTPKGTVETRIRDISPAGMFIEMEKMPAFAAVFPVLLQLPDGEPPLLVTVQSVRQETGASGRAPGVGVRFVGGTDEFRVRLDAFLRPDPR